MRDIASQAKAAGVAVSVTLVLAACAHPFGPRGTAEPVAPSWETAPVASLDDAADDAAIWVARDPANSVIIGTDKRDTGGLFVYDLDGAVRQFLRVGPMNNVDVRPMGAHDGLAVATHRRTGLVELFTINADSVVAPLASFPTPLADPYGVCLGVAGAGAYHVGVTATDDGFAQFRLTLDEDGQPAATLVRELSFGAQAEGCVFDDRTGDVFIAVEEAAIHRYDADPAAGDARETIAVIDRIQLTADIEGLTIYPLGAEGGWLIASSQGDDSFALFALPQAEFVGRFTVVASADGSVDRVTHTDGLDVVAAALPGFPDGLVVVQDDENTTPDGAVLAQNFKVVDWRRVAAALALQSEAAAPGAVAP